MIGKGSKYDMMHKALLRNGIMSNSDINSISLIDAGQDKSDGSFILKFNSDSPFEVCGIENVLNYIKNNTYN